MKKLKNQKGFTMLENVLATTILAFALLGGMMIMQNATANTVNGDMGTIATQLANEKIEEIMADKVYNGYDYMTNSNYSAESSVGIYEMSRNVTFTEVSSEDLSTYEADSGVTMVNVTVSWGSGEDQSAEVTTLITDFE